MRIDENRYLASVERLVLLLRWFRGDAPPEVVFLDPATGEALGGAEAVHWDGFPLQQAIDAATRRGAFTIGPRHRSGTALDRVARCDSWTAAEPAPAPSSSRPGPALGCQASPSLVGLHWSALRVWSDGREREVLVLDEQGRITELFRWKRGRPTPGMWFVDIVTGSSLADPGAVNWADFPEPRASDSEPKLRAPEV